MSVVKKKCTVSVFILSSVFQSGLTNGGPAGLVYGFIFVWAGTALQTAVMAELASMFVSQSIQLWIILTKEK